MNSANKIILGIIFLVLIANTVSAVIVDAEYITLYPGEEGTVTLDVENNENFDIEGVTISLLLNNVPFTSVGSSVKDVDDLDEDDDDSVRFTLRPSTSIEPGDYDIPYRIKYVNANNNAENFTEEGSFGIRVSSRTDLDFLIEIQNSAIIGREGSISLEIINKGLGEIKSVSVQIFPQGFEILSTEKVFVGNIDAEDSDTATFDVIYQTQNPVFTARITYKDFDNIDQTEGVNFPVRVYTEEEALNRGLISESNTSKYLITIVFLLVAWFVWRKVKKRRQRKKKEMAGR